MLKAGFIGLGRMGLTHFSILNTHPSVQISAVCDQSKILVNIFNKYVGVNTFTDYRAMIDKTDLDFVIVSTPTDSHAEIIKYALANDLHVFVEKPFVLNTAQSEDILKMCNEKTLVNQVGYVNRFNEIFMQIKDFIDANLFGQIKYFKSEMLGGAVLKDSKSGWRGKRNFGGGCMFDFASHCIDLVIYLINSPDSVAASIMQSIFSSNVEDLVSSTFIYNNGISGNIMVNWSDASYRKPALRLEIYGTKGKILADQFTYKIFMSEADESRGLFKGWNTRYLAEFSKGTRFYLRGSDYTRQLDYLVDHIEREESDKNINSFAEALKTNIIMEKIIKDFGERF